MLYNQHPDCQAYRYTAVVLSGSGQYSPRQRNDPGTSPWSLPFRVLVLPPLWEVGQYI
jgi:hypothetical protein